MISQKDNNFIKGSILGQKFGLSLGIICLVLSVTLYIFANQKLSRINPFHKMAQLDKQIVDIKTETKKEVVLKRILLDTEIYLNSLISSHHILLIRITAASCGFLFFLGYICCAWYYHDKRFLSIIKKINKE